MSEKKREHMDIRRAQRDDLASLLELYTHLHGNALPAFDEKLETLWNDILADKNHHIIVGVSDGAIVASCVMIIVPNLTQAQRPYALIENVITLPASRNRGYATQVLHFAKELATRHRCYKIMLMTGAKTEETLRLYERAGYNRADKTAFVQWLD